MKNVRRRRGPSYDELLKALALSIVKTAKQYDAHTLYLWQTVPSIGQSLSLVLLCEIHDAEKKPKPRSEGECVS